MDCGQRLLGPHVCSNCIELSTIAIPHNTVGADERRPIGTENNNPEVLLQGHYEPNMDVLEDGVSGNNPLIPRGMVTRQMPPSTAPSEMCHHNLPTYEEAITPGPEIPIRTRILPNEQDILHCNDYSSDPDEAWIHFEILSPTRPRGRHRNANIRRERWRYPSPVYDHIYCDKIEIRPPSHRMRNTGSARTCAKHNHHHHHHHPVSGRDDASSQEMRLIQHMQKVPTDDNHHTIKGLLLIDDTEQVGHLMEILVTMDHLVMTDVDLQDMDHQEVDHQGEDHLVPLDHPEILNPLDKEDHQEYLDLKEKEDILDHQDRWEE